MNCRQSDCWKLGLARYAAPGATRAGGTIDEGIMVERWGQGQPGISLRQQPQEACVLYKARCPQHADLPICPCGVGCDGWIRHAAAHALHSILLPRAGLPTCPCPATHHLLAQRAQALDCERVPHLRHQDDGVGLGSWQSSTAHCGQGQQAQASPTSRVEVSLVMGWPELRAPWAGACGPSWPPCSPAAAPGPARPGRPPPPASGPRGRARALARSGPEML